MDEHETVRGLLARLTPAEKIALLHQATPGVDRLGLAAFHTGAEAAHGVAWLDTATVFPQSVGLAATWDPELIRAVGTVVGTELRAKHVADPDVSLNAWAPVVNPLRHPRWGRNEEGFSEDPSLTAELATAYAAGMRGQDTVWRVVPTLKHFCGYNNETDRDVSSSQLRRRVLHEYELPAFRGPIGAGVVGAVMPSYNLVNGRPAHVSAELLDELRSWTDEELLVVSDAYAPSNLAESQHYFGDHATSHAAALRAGVDSFTDHGRDSGPTIARVAEALERGLIGWAEVDRAVERLLLLRARTGELGPYDPYDAGPSAITADDLDLPAHRELARTAAAASVVLLRNEGLLPLEPRGAIAVIGPFAERVLRDWYSGTPPYTVSITTALAEAMGAAGEVRAVDGADRVTLRPAGTFGHLRAVDGRITADGDGVEDACAFTCTDWGESVSTLAAADGRLWTVPDGRWVEASAERVDGWEVQESFRLHRRDDGTWSIQHLGTRKWLRVDVAGGLSAATSGPERATRFVRSILRDGLVAAREAAEWADTVVVTVGNDPHLLGRETQDRPTISLPTRQSELVRAAREANGRVVLSIVSSYPYALDEVAAGIPAIVWTSHGGQEVGHGLVDVLTGAVEPSGRLPQTWPAGDDQLTDLFDYDIITAGATYWYSDRVPLFPFGHGLGYAEVAYADLQVEQPPSDGAPVRATVRVTNPGTRVVSEVVQAYTTAPTHRLRFPRRLAGWSRVRLEPGESRSVTLELPADRFAVYDVTTSAMLVERGHYEIQVGRSAGDIRCRAGLDLDGAVVAPWDLSRPVDAAAFDRCERIRLVPREPLHGEVVEARDGWIAFTAVDLADAEDLELRVQATRSGGRVRVELGGRVLGTVTGGTGWRTESLQIQAAVGELRLHLRDARVDTLRVI